MNLNYSTASALWHKAIDEMADPPRGIPLTWWPSLTKLTGGLRPHELTLVCAPTGAGKTQLMANISAQLLEQRIAHFVAPVETGDVDYMKRVASCLARQDYNDGDPVSPEALAHLEHIAGKTMRGPMTVASYDNRVDAKDMLDMLAYQHAQYGAQVAVLDNLNFFLKIASSHMERAVMDEAMHEFVMMAKKLPPHIILIVHPRKTEGGRVVSEFDIKGSSTAVQECSNVLLFNRAESEDIESNKRLPTDRELVFRKLRKRGHAVGKPTWLRYEGGRYYEYLGAKC